MKIAGFGDSFIFQKTEGTYPWLLEHAFNADFVSYGYPGSSIWDAFFQFRNCPTYYDVVIFAWTNRARFYHPNYRNICDQNARNHKDSTDPVWQAANQYYNYLCFHDKLDYEFCAFFYWLDDFLKDNYPNTKFIHMWSFLRNTNIINLQNGYKSNDSDYYHKFKHQVELRPSLIELSLKDEWPGDLSKEIRSNHLSYKMQGFLAQHLIHAIKNYNPGVIIDMQ